MVAKELRDFKKNDLYTQYALASAKQALEDSKLLESDTAQSSCEVFEVQKGDELPNTYMYDYSRLALRQIEKAGYRLAALLESIF